MRLTVPTYEPDDIVNVKFFDFDLALELGNQRSNVRYEFDGECLTQKEWARKTGINRDTIAKRLKYGWTIEDALTKPVKPRNVKYDLEEQSLTLKEWSKKTGIKELTLFNRINYYGCHDNTHAERERK